MYECEKCGSDESRLPGVFLAVNNDMVDDADTPNFDAIYNSICWENKLEVYDISGEAISENIGKAWNLFWQKIGNEKMKWFCSKRCAAEFLLEEKEI
jgi:hypothetical protein